MEPPPTVTSPTVSALLQPLSSHPNVSFTSRLSLSRTRLSRITACPKWKSGPCFKTEIYQQATKYCGKEEEQFLLFSIIFSIYLLLGSQIKDSLLKLVVRLIAFLSSANPICRSTDISKCLIESLGFRYNESRLYLHLFLYKSHLRTTANQGLLLKAGDTVYLQLHIAFLYQF